ncbi:MAG: DNRLRE domain-containing protein [Bacteroidota bacterium]
MRNQHRSNTLTVVLALFTAIGAVQFRASAQDKSFILIGDTHFDKLTLHDMTWLQTNYPNDVSQVNNYSQITQNNFSALIAEILHQAQTVTPAAAGITHTGDLQEGLAGSLALATQMAQVALDSLHLPTFSVPWILTKGNHDITGPGAPEAYNSVVLPVVSSEIGKSVTSTYYSYRVGEVQFIVLDCYDSNLLTFLETELTATSAPYKVILTHMPVIPVTGRLWHIYQNDSGKRQTLLNLIAKHKALVICGHLHKYSVVKRSTDFGPIVQIMMGSVISNRNANTPGDYITTYGPGLVDLEPGFDPATAATRRAYLTAEAPYITDFRMAEMPGYGVLSLNSTTGEWTLKAYAGLGEHLYQTVSLISYRLRVNTVGNGTVSVAPNDSVFLVGSKVVLTAQCPLGWRFDGWSGDRTGTANPDTVVMDGQKTITATFSQIPAGQYEVRTMVVGSGVVVAEPAGPYYSLNTVVTLKARPSAGSKFQGWSGDATGTDTVMTVTVDGNKGVTATFKKLESYRINVRTGQHGSVTFEPAGGVYVEGTDVTLRATGETGWELYEWLGDINGKTSPQTITVNEGKDIRAVFRKTGGSVQEVAATHDSYVQGFLKASTNFNGDSCLRVREGSSDMNRFRTYVQFDLHGLAGNVLGAVLKLQVRSAGLPDGRGVGAGVFGVSTDGWTETTLKWTGAPTGGTMADTVLVCEVGKVYGWDIGTMVTTELGGDKVLSVMVKDFLAGDRRIDFERREDGKGPVLALITDGATGVEKADGIPIEFVLHQNYPNPFNPETTIRFDLPLSSRVSMKVYDVLGKEIATLADQDMSAGIHAIQWKPTLAPSGIYFCRLTAGSFSSGIKLLYLK